MNPPRIGKWTSSPLTSMSGQPGLSMPGGPWGSGTGTGTDGALGTVASVMPAPRPDRPAARRGRRARSGGTVIGTPSLPSG